LVRVLERRLAAVLAADVAGYCRLMGADAARLKPPIAGASSRRPGRKRETLGLARFRIV
jgi:hypothetical protein